MIEGVTSSGLPEMFEERLDGYACRVEHTLECPTGDFLLPEHNHRNAHGPVRRSLYVGPVTALLGCLARNKPHPFERRTDLRTGT